MELLRDKSQVLQAEGGVRPPGCGAGMELPHALEMCEQEQPLSPAQPSRLHPPRARMRVFWSASHVHYCCPGVSGHTQPLISLKTHLAGGWTLTSQPRSVTWVSLRS